MGSEEIDERSGLTIDNQPFSCFQQKSLILMRLLDDIDAVVNGRY